MKWYKNTWSIYYGNGGGEGSITINNIILGPYLYNNKLYGTKELPMYSLYLRSAILDQNYEISPVSGKSLSYSYFRVVGVPDDQTIPSKWGNEISGDTISGQYKFSQNIAGYIIGGWSIPCKFILKLKDGTTLTGDSLQASGFSSRFPSDSYCGIVFKNVKDSKSITFGSTSVGSTNATLDSNQQYSIIDFGSTPQEIPAFIKDWIVANTEEVTEERPALTISLRSINGIKLKTENCICERNIEVVPNLQEKTVTVNGPITPDDGYSGLSKVVVNVNDETPYFDGTIEISGGLISFTIDGTEYQAEEGMTWESWVNSSYNTGGFSFNGAWSNVVYKEEPDGYYVYNTANDALVGRTGIEENSSNYELNIVSNGVYKTKYLSYAGGSD